MPKFIIEMEIQGAGKLTGEQLRMISQKSKDIRISNLALVANVLDLSIEVTVK